MQPPGASSPPASPAAEGPSLLLAFGEDEPRAYPLRRGEGLSLALGPRGELVVELRGEAPAAAAWVQEEAGLIWLRPSGVAPLELNGRPLEQARCLFSNDRLGLGRHRLLLQRDPGASAGPRLLDRAEFEARLEQELARFVRHRRPLAVALYLLPELPGPGQERLCAELGGLVRLGDLLAFEPGGRLWALFPDTGDSAEIPARRLLEELGRRAPGLRAALALCPLDGAQAEPLLRALRGAAESGGPGCLARPVPAAETVELAGVSVVAADPRMRQLFSVVAALARSSLPVLISGETGVGKEIVAAALHEWSPRATGRLVSINCAALAETLLEGELFGHERGAFSGAVGARVGLLETASGGTVFLDEVGDASPRVQAELLRVLETGRLRRLGSNQERSVDLRIVAASNRPLEADVAAGRFRRDLYYRLAAARLEVPALRERPLDLPRMAQQFLDAACRELGRVSPALEEGALRRLAEHSWPGNVRELRNLMGYLAAVVEGPQVREGHLPATLGGAVAAEPPPAGDGPLPSPLGPLRPLAEEIEELERRRIAQALELAGGVRLRAAELIGMPVRTLTDKLKRYGLQHLGRGEGGKG